MQFLKTVGKTLACTAAVLMLAVPVMAGNGKGISSGQGSGDRTRTQTRTPGSCKNIETNSDVTLLVHNGKGAGNGSGPIDLCECTHDLCACDA